MAAYCRIECPVIVIFINDHYILPVQSSYLGESFLAISEKKKVYIDYLC
jgi:hypothetical protein